MKVWLLQKLKRIFLHEADSVDLETLKLRSADYILILDRIPAYPVGDGPRTGDVE
jgi:hypothetical protein